MIYNKATVEIYKTLQSDFEEFKQHYQVDFTELKAKCISDINTQQKTLALLQEYLVSREDEVEKFLERMSNNVNILLAYAQYDATTNRMYSEMSRKQVEALFNTPWYKKLFKSQREEILKEVEIDIYAEYNPKLNEIQARISEATKDIIKNSSVESQESQESQE